MPDSEITAPTLQSGSEEDLLEKVFNFNRFLSENKKFHIQN